MRSGEGRRQAFTNLLRLVFRQLQFSGSHAGQRRHQHKRNRTHVPCLLKGDDACDWVRRVVPPSRGLQRSCSPEVQQRKERASLWMPAPLSFNYFAQAQPTHSHTSHVHVSPLQSGHRQTSQPQLAAFAFVLAAAQHALTADTGAAAALTQPQLPHSHTSHVQNWPLQSGHRQSVQPQVDFDFA
jgi:hypothetical protein